MVTKNDFTPADWKTLRDTQYLVGFATLLAGSSGLATVKEMIALSLGIIENQGSSIPLIRDLTSREEMEQAQASLKQSLGGAESTPTSERMRVRALEQTRLSLSLVGAKGSSEELDAFRRLLYGIAEKVANAAREGGFLGFGGKQISDDERSFLDDLRNNLQLERVKRA